MNLSAGGWLYLQWETTEAKLQKWNLVQSILIVVKSCLVFSLPAESYIMRSIGCNLLEYSILIYTAQSRKLEKCITFIKIQNSWGGVQFNIIIPPNIFCIELVNISSENTSYFMLEDSLWLQLIYFSTAIAFWFVKYLFSNLWGHSKLTTSEC